jgi:carbamoyl-phosphate synthase small subunit
MPQHPRVLKESHRRALGVDRPLAITFVALPTGALSLSLLPSHAPALLALADGTVFRGRSVGAATARAGEVVFNTALTGYQEILTDPSYRGQHVTLTYPHIGNVGTNAQDEEAAAVHASGLIVRDVPQVHSNFRSQMSLTAYLQRHGVPGIADIDTRQLTRHLRTHGAQNGCILALADGQAITDSQVAKALGMAREAPSMAGLDLASVVTTREPYRWTEGEWRLQAASGEPGFSNRVSASPPVLDSRWWPTTSASSATSSACWPNAAATSTWCPPAPPPLRPWP